MSLDLSALNNLRTQTPISFNAPLAGLTTFGIGGPALALVTVDEESELRDVLALSQQFKWPVFVLGGGSNVLFDDRGFPGVVLKLGVGFASVRAIGRSILAGAAVSAKMVAKLAKANDLSGLEPLVGLPGTIGGAVKLNAGGRLGAIGEVVKRIRVMAVDGTIRDYGREVIRYEYRHLDLDLEGGIIIEVELSLKPEEPRRISSNIEKSLDLRLSQPKGMSAGCVFKNPQKLASGLGDLIYQKEPIDETPPLSAGQMIDLCGFKGRKIGGAMVSLEHANFIVNVGGARAADVVALIAEIRQGVFSRFGLELETEIVTPFRLAEENGG
ncbi:MAG: UDP-N-acetylmuramate dehydrogenase [Deltaproteobacteria bacterium]|jgi:UDP-N-acetylmuramate dehydrogenase|nr:UDP-N-acetylmuramate dehydrogenase [Deltaproteobacteria bacterium]